jgi:hypothetical protein
MNNMKTRAADEEEPCVQWTLLAPLPPALALHVLAALPPDERARSGAACSAVCRTWRAALRDPARFLAGDALSD